MHRKWWALVAVCLGIFMLILDINVVSVALPDIQRSLHSSFSDLQWVIDAYSLTLASFLLTAGAAGDMFGRRRLFVIGLTAFSVCSLACGLSTSPLWLNVARAFQGVGGAIMFATSLALIAQAFTGKDRGIAFGVYGAVIGAAGALGPLVGGVVTSGVGWRWIFFINIPIGLAAIVITLVKVAESRDPARRRVDWIGFVTFSGSLFMLVFALVQGNASGWGSPKIVTLLAGSAALMVAFLVAESRRPDPMLDLALFKRPAMVGVSLSAFVLSSTIFAMFLYLTIYMQDVLGFSPLATGLRFLPISVLSVLVAPVTGKLSVRVHTRFLLGLGLVLIALGCNLAAHVTGDSLWTVLLPGFLVAGVGIGMTNPVVASATVSVVPADRAGMASGSSNTFRQVGVATGVAALGAVFLSQIRPNTAAALASTPSGRLVLHQGGSRLFTVVDEGAVRQAAATIPTAAAHTLLHAYQVGFATTLDDLLAICTVVCAIGAVAAIALVRQRDFVPAVSPAAAEAEAARSPADSRDRARRRSRTEPRYKHSRRKGPRVLAPQPVASERASAVGSTPPREGPSPGLPTSAPRG